MGSRWTARPLTALLTPSVPLTPKGMKKSHAVALGLRALKVKPDAVLTSPWLRAVQTAEIFSEVMGFSSKKIVQVDALKGTSTPAELFRELAKLRAELGAVLWPRAAPAPGHRAGSAHRRENYGTEKSRRRLPGDGPHFPAAGSTHRAVSAEHAAAAGQIRLE